MDHETAKELFSDFLEGELSEQQEAELRTHLEDCRSCRAELEALRETLRSLSGLKQIQPPEGFARKVQQRIRRRSRGRFFSAESFLKRVPFEWISFIIILLMLVMYYMVALQGQVKGVKPAPAKDGGARIEQKRAPIDGSTTIETAPQMDSQGSND